MAIYSKITIFALKSIKYIMERINRLKVVLAEQEKTNKWHAEQLGKDCSTISKWCTNTTQPDLVTLTRIAEILGIDRRDLLMPQKK